MEIDELDYEKDEQNNSYVRAICQDQMAIELEDDWIHKVEIENQLAGEALRAVLDMSESRWKPGRISLTNRATLEPLISKSASEALNELVKAYGGIIRARVTFEGGKVTGRYIDWYAEEDWEDFTGIRWEEGRNLQKIKKTVVQRWVKTSIIPYGKKLDSNTVYWIVVQRTTNKTTAQNTVNALKAKGFKEADYVEEESEYVVRAKVYKMKAWAEKELYVVREKGWPQATVEEKQLDGSGGIEQNPAGNDGEYITIKDVEWSRDKGHPYDKPKGEEFMVDPEAVQIWGRPNYDGSSRHRWAQVHWDEIEEPEELAEAAAEWLKEHNHEYATYEAEVVDRSMEPGRSHESIRLGTAGHIIDDSFRPPIEVRVRVIALEVNLNDRTQVKITLGNFTPSALETVSNVDKELQRKVSKGAPITLLDTTVQTTKDRLRRSRGYKYESETMGTIWSDGPYGDPETQSYVQVKGGIIALADRWDPVAGEPDWRTGITGSGISADMITTGTLNAELVNIESVNEVGSRLIRMNNGELHTYTNDVKTMKVGGYSVQIFDHGDFDPNPNNDMVGHLAMSWRGTTGDGPGEASLRGLALSTLKDFVRITQDEYDPERGYYTIKKTGFGAFFTSPPYEGWRNGWAQIQLPYTFFGESSAHIDANNHSSGDAAIRLKADQDSYIFVRSNGEVHIQSGGLAKLRFMPNHYVTTNGIQHHALLIRGWSDNKWYPVEVRPTPVDF